MPTSQPMTSPLGILLMVAAVYLVIRSPQKLHTLGRIVIAFAVTIILFIIPGAILRIGDPRAWGRIGGLVGLLMAVIAGWWRMRSIKRASAQVTEEPPKEKP